jgi:sugar/nucleoside kinase (ribokinase family)
MLAPSTLLLLEDPYPQANAYAEIGRVLDNLAGEALAGAWVLSRLGRSVKLAGRWLAGSPGDRRLMRRLVKAGIDCSAVRVDSHYKPIEEIVISDGKTRTVLGSYKKILFGEPQWEPPDERDVAESRIVLLDPFLGAESELCADYCAKAGVPYLSIDTGFEGRIAKGAAALIVSEEFLLREYPERASWPEIFEEYAEACGGLIIFTFGPEVLWYALPGKGRREMRIMKPFSVSARDSTGAGDSFRAGLAHAFLDGHGWEACLKRACAVAGMVCERFPGVLESPRAAELEAFLEARKGSGEGEPMRVAPRR